MTSSIPLGSTMFGNDIGPGLRLAVDKRSHPSDKVDEIIEVGQRSCWPGHLRLSASLVSLAQLPSSHYETRGDWQTGQN